LPIEISTRLQVNQYYRFDLEIDISLISLIVKNGNLVGAAGAVRDSEIIGKNTGGRGDDVAYFYRINAMIVVKANDSIRIKTLAGYTYLGADGSFRNIQGYKRFINDEEIPCQHGWGATGAENRNPVPADAGSLRHGEFGGKASRGGDFEGAGRDLHGIKGYGDVIADVRVKIRALYGDGGAGSAGPRGNQYHRSG